MAAQTDVNMIVSTGAYTFNDVPAPFSFYGPGLLCDAPEPMIDHFVKDIVEGMRRHGHQSRRAQMRHRRAGSNPGRRARDARGGEDALITGTPITVHTAPKEETGLIASACSPRKA